MNDNQQDVFSWYKLCYALDTNLKDVAKNEVEKLKLEKYKLREDIKILNNPLEQIYGMSKSTNILVCALDYYNNLTAKKKFIPICNNVLMQKL